MSYVRLKHLLSALTLEAVGHPSQAAWAAVAAAYAEQASAEQPAVPWRDCLERAAALGAPFGWAPTRRDLIYLVRRGLLVRRGDLVALPETFVPHLNDVRRQTARLLAAIADVRGAPRTGETGGPLVAAVLFNAGLFFACHEWGEGLWRQAPPETREFYHGLVQVAAAFYHYEKGNLRGSRALLTRGLARLRGFPGSYLGLDVGRLRADLAPWNQHFAGGPRPPDCPRIHRRQQQ
ncbi:MAG TPA: DUF309 domain-containing protein [bacterium]|nr:DUF309 domain-containing protein [bacterium]